MFIQQLFEDSAKRIIVTYPGRFQPFHKGHAEVFANLQRQFGSENVFIVTSNKTDAVKSPFNFSDKVRFMHAMGIPNHQIIETDKVYDLPGRFEPVRDQVVFITVVGAPDAKRLNPGAVKKDGSQSYFQNVPHDKNEFETADKHGYVIIEPEHPETIVIGGQKYDVSHGTPTRELWNQIRDNPQQRGEFVTQLYGRADGDLANTLDKIPTGAAPAPEPAAKMKNVKKDLTKVQHDPNAEQPVAEAGYGSNRGYSQGFASPHAPSLGGQRRREDDEYHVPDPVDTSIWYIRANGKIIKDKMGTPFQFRSKEAARKSAMTMMAKPFNAGKKFMLTTRPEDEAPVTESVTHRIGLTVTDPNHPMVSKRGETYHKTVRVTGDDREKAINGAIAHYRRKGYKVHDHHYIGTVDDEPINELSPKTLGSYAKKAAVDAKFLGHQAGAQQGDAMAHAKRPGDGADAGVDLDDRAHKRLKGVGRAVDKLSGVNEFAPPGGDSGDDGFSDDTLKRMAAQWYNGDEDPRVEKTLMAAGWEIGQDEGYDDEPGVFVVQSGDINGNSYMSWPADELRQGVAEGKKKSDTYHIVNKDGKPANLASYADKESAVKDRDAKHPGAEVRQVGPRGKVKGVAEGSELKQAKRKYNQAAKDANLDQVGAGKKIDTMKKSLRQKDVDNKKQDVNESAEELSVGDPVIISGQGIEFEGKTGDIDSFGDMKRFVVVNLYNHGKHSFHSSDVSYNDYADREDDLDEDLYQYDKEDPYNSEFAPRAGMGRMTLRGWKQQMIKRTAELAQQMAAAGQDIDKSALWDNVHAKLKSMNMDPIAQEIEQAQAELEKIRQRGGVRSRAFAK